MKRWITAAGALLMITTSGCEPIALDPIQPERGSGGSGGTGGMSGTGSTATAGGTGTGGALACQPNTVVPCYSGPPGTEGVGQCAAGTQTCNPDGMAYGPCIGEILPAAEICDAAMQDENCDGHGYGCVCGDGILDPGESCDDGNTTGGDACPATCVRHSIVKVAVGMLHICALLDDASVKCWGSNTYGRLGLGDTLRRGDQPNEMGDNLPAVDLGTGKTAVDIAAGLNHSCALLGDGSVKCWGSNMYGQLGLGDTLDRGDQPNEMGDSLPAIDLGTGISVVSISVGDFQSCALLNDGRVKCWGSNSHGELGLGDVSYRGDQPGEMGGSLPAVDLGTGKTASQVSLGLQHSCALLNDGSVKCWGNNEGGGLGLGDTNTRGDGPNEMGDNLPAVDLGTGETAMAVTVGGGFTCALLQSGHVKCWGVNDLGQLGLGDTITRGDGPLEMGDYLPPVDLGTAVMPSAIISRNGQTCAIVNAGRIKCWGFNIYGQLGLGDTLYRGANLGEMGDYLPFVGL